MNILTYIAIFLFLIVVYFLGAVIRMFFVHTEDDTYFAAFKNMVVGMFAIVGAVAVIRTQGNTVLWGFILVAILYLLLERPKIQIKTLSVKIYPVVIMGVISIVFYIFQGVFFYEPPYNRVAHGDYYSYSELINYMWNNHVETSTFRTNYFQNPSLWTVGPFHYPELWLASIFYGLFNFDIIESQVVISHVIIVSILVMGMIALVRSITKDKFMLAFGIVSVFLGGVVLVNVLPQAVDYVFFCGCSPKFAILSILYVWATLLMLKHDNRFFYPLLLLPIASITLAPVIGIVLFWIVLYFQKR